MRLSNILLRFTLYANAVMQNTITRTLAPSLHTIRVHVECFNVQCFSVITVHVRMHEENVRLRCKLTSNKKKINSKNSLNNSHIDSKPKLKPTVVSERTKVKRSHEMNA